MGNQTNTVPGENFEKVVPSLKGAFEFSNKSQPIAVWESALETQRQFVERPQQDGIHAVPGRPGQWSDPQMCLWEDSVGVVF